MNGKLILATIFMLLISKLSLSQTLWPVSPQDEQATINGTIGEYRPTNRFHLEVDIVNGGNYNVYATNAGKAKLSPFPAESPVRDSAVDNTLSLCTIKKTLAIVGTGTPAAFGCVFFTNKNCGAEDYGDDPF